MFARLASLVKVRTLAMDGQLAAHYPLLTTPHALLTTPRILHTRYIRPHRAATCWVLPSSPSTPTRAASQRCRRSLMATARSSIRSWSFVSRRISSLCGCATRGGCTRTASRRPSGRASGGPCRLSGRRAVIPCEWIAHAPAYITRSLSTYALTHPRALRPQNQPGLATALGGKPRDGSFWMTFGDFISGFNKVNVCRLFGKGCKERGIRTARWALPRGEHRCSTAAHYRCSLPRVTRAVRAQGTFSESPARGTRRRREGCCARGPAPRGVATRRS